MSIGQRLKMLRKSINFSQDEMADALKCKRPMLSLYENGKTSIPDEIYLIVNNLYNVDLNWLLTGEGEMYISQQPTSVLNTNTNIVNDLKQEITTLRNKNAEQSELIIELFKKLTDLQNKIISNKI